jgi:hypothetical protein
LKIHHRRAFLAIDAVFGLTIIAAVTVVLIGTVNHERSAELRLSDSRSALHLAEHALLNLQHGQPLPPVSGDTHLAIHPANGGSAPAGYVWATVDATVHGHHRSLTGVVPLGYLSDRGGK